MAGGWEPRKGKDGVWRLLHMSPSGGYARDDDGEPLTFATKAEADKGRRKLERGMTMIPRVQSDIFLDRASRGRYR